MKAGDLVTRMTDPGIGTNEDRWTGTVESVSGDFAWVVERWWRDIEGNMFALPDAKCHIALLAKA